MMVPSFRRHYTTAVKNAIRRTDTFADTIEVRTGRASPSDRLAPPAYRNRPQPGARARVGGSNDEPGATAECRAVPCRALSLPGEGDSGDQGPVGSFTRLQPTTTASRV